jgi:hypothetical protein
MPFGVSILTSSTESPAGLPSKSIRLSQCGVLQVPGARYELENDVSAAGTCFSIQADNITLNLNGHTITYNTANQEFARFGILGIPCWESDLSSGSASGNPCGPAFNNFAAYGGTITEGQGRAGDYAHAIRFGQFGGSGKIGPTIHDITFNISSRSAKALFVNYQASGPGNVAFFRNTINSTVVRIVSRSSIDGAMVTVQGCTEMKGTNATFHDNLMRGGPQGGIHTDCPQASIYNNTIEHGNLKGKQTNGICDAVLGCQYTNDFAIYAWGRAQNVHDNTITPSEGRGISFDGKSSTGSIARNNKISGALEYDNNAEYNGCQIGGAYGVQFDDEAHNDTVEENIVNVRASLCNAQALRVTDSRTQANVSRNNNYTAERAGDGGGFAIGFGAEGPKGFTSQEDVFTADTFNVAFDWSGASNLIFRGDTFVRGPHPAANYATISFRNGQSNPVENVHFIDSVFRNGAAKDSTNLKAIKSSADWPGPGEYFIDWTYSLVTRDKAGRNIAGAAVSITDALGKEVFSGETSIGGNISAVLTEFRMFNTKIGLSKEMHTPHVVSVRKAGCKPHSFRETVSQTLSKTIGLECP